MNALAQRNKKVLRGLGIAETIIGMIFLAIQIATTVVASSTGSSLVTGFLSVACLIVAGSLGIASGSENPSAGLINSHMAFSIIGAIICLIGAIIGSAAVPLLLASINQFGGEFANEFQIRTDPKVEGAIALVFIALILSYICAILFIVSSAYCCKTTSSLGYGGCCCGDAAPMTYVVQTQQVSAGQGVVYNGQPNMALSGVNYAHTAPAYEAQKPSFEPLPNKL